MPTAVRETSKPLLYGNLQKMLGSLAADNPQTPRDGLSVPERTFWRLRSDWRKSGLNIKHAGHQWKRLCSLISGFQLLAFSCFTGLILSAPGNTLHPLWPCCHKGGGVFYSLLPFPQKRLLLGLGKGKTQEPRERQLIFGPVCAL